MKWTYTFVLLLSMMFFSEKISAQLSCEYTLELFDSFGDGWNGASITITLNGMEETYTLDNINDDGFFNSFTITVMDGDEIIFDYFPGTFENEVSYALYNSEGQLVWGDGPFPAIGEIFTGNIICPSCPVPPPGSISIDDVRAFTAEFSWVPSDPNGDYIIEYDTLGFSQGMGTIVSTMDDDITLVNLEENTAYEFYISVACANGDTSNVLGPYPFTTLWANNVGVSNISMPESACGLGIADTIEVTLENFGGNPQSLIPFNYSVNGIPGGVSQPVDGFYTGVLGKDSSVVIAFETTFDFSEPGEYVIQAWTDLEADSVITNDTTTITIVNIPIITDYPYFIDFEEWSGGWMVGEDSENPTWAFGQPAGLVINNAASGQNAWVTNLEGNYNNQEFSYLVSPCLDFTSLTEDPRIAFSINFDSESCCDEGWVEVSIDGGDTWSKVGTSGTGVNWYNDATNQWWDGDGGFSGWAAAFNTLDGTAGESDVRVRFVFSTDFSVVREGFGIDDVFISPPLVNDLAALSVDHATELDCGSDLDQVVLTISNFGTATQTGFDVYYSVNGGAPVMENVGAISIAPGEETEYTFTTPFDSSIPGTYEITAWTSLASDQFEINDVTAFTFSTAAFIPFVEDFEGMVLPEDWVTDGGVTNAHSNVSYVIFDNLWSSDNDFEIITPNIGLIEPNDSLTFDYRYVDFSNNGQDATTLGAGDSLQVQISTDCGETYTNVLTIDTSNHVASNVMTNVVIHLDDYVGQAIKVRFFATWATGDYYLDIDNVNIIRCPESLNLSADVVNETVEEGFDGIATIIAEEGLEPYTYAWSTGDSTKTVVGLTAGIYQVIVTDRAGCTDIIEFEIETVTSVEQIDNITSISLAPNPTAGNSLLKVTFAEAVDARIQVVSMVGQVLFEQVERNITESTYDIDLNPYADGMYLVRIIVDNKVHTEKLIRLSAR